MTEKPFVGLEKKIARYLNRNLDGAEYTKMAEWMGKDRDKFNHWVAEKGGSNV